MLVDKLGMKTILVAAAVLLLAVLAACGSPSEDAGADGDASSGAALLRIRPLTAGPRQCRSRRPLRPVAKLYSPVAR